MEGVSDPAYPWLSEWVKGAVPGNIWADLLAGRSGGADVLLPPMEAVIARLEATGPLRLARKRRDFRRGADHRNQLNLRLELLVAYKLAQGSIPFEFGGEAQPDIGVTTGPCPIWLEITSKDRDDIAALHDEMEIALADLPVIAHLRIPQRHLKIHIDARQAMCERVRLAATTMTGPHQIVPLTEVHGSASITAVEGLGISRVVLDVNSELTLHYYNIERELFNVLGTKTSQALKGDFHANTLLVVDVSRLRLPGCALNPRGGRTSPTHQSTGPTCRSSVYSSALRPSTPSTSVEPLCSDPTSPRPRSQPSIP